MIENHHKMILILFLLNSFLKQCRTNDIESDSNNVSDIRIEAEFVKDYFNERNINVAVIFACTLPESMEMLRILMDNRTVVSKYFYFDMGQFFIRMVTAPYNKIGIYLNYSCEFGRYIFSKSSSKKLFNERYVWVLINDHLNEVNKLGRYNLQLDTDMIFTAMNKDNDTIDYNSADYFDSGGDNNFTESNSIFLYDIYKIQNDLPIVATCAGLWNLDNRLIMNLTGTKMSRRSDFQGMIVNGTGVISQINFNDTFSESAVILQLLMDIRYKTHLDILNRFPLVMNMNLAKMYNFTLNVKFAKDWGQLQPDGSFDGMLGDIEKGRSELGLTTVIMNTSLLNIMDFSFPIWKFRPLFIYGNPRRFGTHHALLAPFSAEAWLLVVCLIFSIMIILTVVRHFSQQSNTDSTISENFVVIIGAIAAQGLSSCSNRLPERITLYLALIIGMLITTFYNSMVVTSLLQPPPPSIKESRQLIESDIRIGITNLTYYVKYFTQSNDELVKRIYTRTLADKGFMSAEQGIHFVRTKKFAFYGEDATMYPIITDTYSNNDVCGLVEIQLIAPYYLPCPHKKSSPLKQFVNSGFHLMRERGIIMRERNLWYREKPLCLGNDVPSIQLQTLLIAYIIYAIGLFLSIVIFTLEVLHFKRKLTHKRRISTNLKNIFDKDARTPGTSRS